MGGTKSFFRAGGGRRSTAILGGSAGATSGRRRRAEIPPAHAADGRSEHRVGRQSRCAGSLGVSSQPSRHLSRRPRPLLAVRGPRREGARRSAKSLIHQAFCVLYRIQETYKPGAQNNGSFIVVERENALLSGSGVKATVLALRCSIMCIENGDVSAHSSSKQITYRRTLPGTFIFGCSHQSLQVTAFHRPHGEADSVDVR